MRVGDIQLDRRITLDPDEIVPTGSYRYDEQSEYPTAVGGLGRYFVDTGRLVLYEADADGADLPEFAIDDALTLTWGAYVLTVTLTAVETVRGGFGGQSAFPDLRFAETIDLTLAVDELTIAVGGGDAVGPRKVWARRQDFMGRDSLISGDDRSFALSRSRFVVRAGANVAIGDVFLDDLGDRRTIEGIAQIGRGRYIELLGKTFSTEPGG